MVKGKALHGERDTRPEVIDAMEYGLRGKTAIVTGASQGIGRAIAHALHQEGVTVTMVGQTRARLEQAARELDTSIAPVHIQVADLSLLAEIERVTAEAIRSMKRVDILVNCAARNKTAGFFSLSDTDIQEAWQVKGLGYVRLVRAIAPYMMERSDGRIVNIIGTAARTPSADFIPGAMVNAALVNFTRGISRELARHNVRINSISPGWTLTERQQRSYEMQAMAQGVPVQEILRREAMTIPLGRHVSLDEIAAMTLMLVSDLTPGLTGEDIIIDGGATPSI
jgi:NAD(P)-dependent dehydrogenase (short-subunit alcohol dehydrogenase family)